MFRSNHRIIKYSGFNTDLYIQVGGINERKIKIKIFNYFFLIRTFLQLLFILVLLLVFRPEHQCFGLIPSNNDVECRPVDIQLYTWSGPEFESGECWHHGHRFGNGATWGRTDIPGSPYCVCEQGQVRIFYNQEQQQSIASDPLTILPSSNGTLLTSNDLAKWPINNITTIRQRIVICSRNRNGLRIKSRDGCMGCKCSHNGHWLCRRKTVVDQSQTVNPRPQQMSR